MLQDCAYLRHRSGCAPGVGRFSFPNPESELVRELAQLPSTDELMRAIRVRNANLLLLDVSDFERAKVLAGAVDDLLPGLPTITFDGQDGARLAPEAYAHGRARSFDSLPVTPDTPADALESARRRLQTHPLARVKLSDLYTFLPANRALEPPPSRSAPVARWPKKLEHALCCSIATWTRGPSSSCSSWGRALR